MSVPELLEVTLENKEDFLKVAESLTRIGIPSVKEGKKKLFQSCHILHKRGKYYIVHFKELFALDGRETDLSEEDVLRRNTIAALLDDWGLCKVVGSKDMLPMLPKNSLKIIRFSEKKDWELVPKYSIGRKH